MLGSPEAAYRAFWVSWSIYAGAALVALLALTMIAAWFCIARPMIRAHREDTGRICRAIQLQGKGESCR